MNIYYKEFSIKSTSEIMPKVYQLDYENNLEVEKELFNTNGRGMKF